MTIRVLPPEEARKIAAGEVIDRPAALVREFLDNAIDAGSSRIEVILEGGGIRKTEVIDDGGGMDKDDLELCWLTHATSKIRGIADLSTAETLGFRGEALAAAAAVARLEILSGTGESEAWLLQTGGGQSDFRLTPSRRTRGTTVRTLGLFDTIPARKRFLKREGAEGALCKQICVEKALAFPSLSFRLTLDGRLDCFLPPADSFKERFALALFSRSEGAFLHEISAQGQGFSAVIVIGGPELFRGDRRRQYVFANGRRINDYSLLQALEYGVQGWFPNGTHPVGALYLDIDPGLADFNIHPAKREVRFRDPGAIHHAVSSALRDFTRRHGYAEKPAWEPEVPEPYMRGMTMEALLEHPPHFAPPPRKMAVYPDEPESPYEYPPGYPEDDHDGGAGFVSEPAPCYASPSPGAEPRLVGRLFGLFILVEQGDTLYIIDQHAAHERILYDRFISADVPRQELLVPIPFSTESDEDDRFLWERREALAKLGVLISGGNGDDAETKVSETKGFETRGFWRIDALPVDWRLSDAETVREILALRNAGENMAERWAATLCCHGAIKDGDYLDREAALALAKETLRLPVPRCPHGRPIWKELSREDLLRAVRRIERPSPGAAVDRD